VAGHLVGGGADHRGVAVGASHAGGGLVGGAGKVLGRGGEGLCVVGDSLDQVQLALQFVVEDRAQIAQLAGAAWDEPKSQVVVVASTQGPGVCDDNPADLGLEQIQDSTDYRGDHDDQGDQQHDRPSGRCIRRPDGFGGPTVHELLEPLNRGTDDALVGVVLLVEHYSTCGRAFLLIAQRSVRRGECELGDGLRHVARGDTARLEHEPLRAGFRVHERVGVGLRLIHERQFIGCRSEPTKPGDHIVPGPGGVDLFPVGIQMATVGGNGVLTRRIGQEVRRRLELQTQRFEFCLSGERPLLAGDGAAYQHHADDQQAGDDHKTGDSGDIDLRLT
jgi:hypothetical protein